MNVKIIKGQHKGSLAIVTDNKKEEIGNGRLYALKDKDGNKIWNGNFTYFPENFVTVI